MPKTTLPPIGLGTMRIDDPATIQEAIELGYRHLDTAQKYDNERVVGQGIARAAVDRDDLFVATKVKEANLADDVVRTARASADRLGLNVIDLLYMHWPALSGPDDRYDPDETLPAFDELVSDGTVRHVGVANFSVDLLEEARDRLAAPILANQVEMHPLLQQADLLEYAQKHDVYLVAYCPLIRGGVGEVPELRAIAEKHDATPGQVSLAWLTGLDNVVAIPKSGGAHLRENRRATALALDADDRDRIASIDREKRVLDPEKGPWNW